MPLGREEETPMPLNDRYLTQKKTRYLTASHAGIRKWLFGTSPETLVLYVRKGGQFGDVRGNAVCKIVCAPQQQGGHAQIQVPVTSGDPHTDTERAATLTSCNSTPAAAAHESGPTAVLHVHQIGQQGHRRRKRGINAAAAEVHPAGKYHAHASPTVSKRR